MQLYSGDTPLLHRLEYQWGETAPLHAHLGHPLSEDTPDLKFSSYGLQGPFDQLVSLGNLIPSTMWTETPPPPLPLTLVSSLSLPPEPGSETSLPAEQRLGHLPQRPHLSCRFQPTHSTSGGPSRTTLPPDPFEKLMSKKTPMMSSMSSQRPKHHCEVPGENQQHLNQRVSTSYSVAET